MNADNTDQRYPRRSAAKFLLDTTKPTD